MADNKELKESLEDFDERLREIEISHSSLSTTIVSMNTNITEMKQMFQKFLIDSERITEIAGKIEAISRIEKETQSLTAKYDDLYKRFVVTEHMCNACGITKVNDYIKDVSDKVNKIEVSISELKDTKGKLSGFWNNILQSVVTVIIIYVFYMVAANIQVSDKLNDKGKDKDSGKKSSISIVTEAQGAVLSNNTSVKIKGVNHNVKMVR